MNAQILTGFLDANFFDTGDLKAYYGFDLASERVLFNSLYPSGVQVISGDLSTVNSEYYPAMSIGVTNNPIAGVASSGLGLFKAKDLLKVSKIVSNDDWTIFFNFKKQSSFVGGDSSVMFSTTPLGNYASGMVVGINSVNRFFLEFKNENAEKKIYTSKNEIHTRQITSLTRFNDQCCLTNHNFLDRENESETFDLSGIQDSSEGWFFGNFKTGAAGYTGYSGLIDDVIIFSGNQTEQNRNKISEVFFLSGYSPEEKITSGTLFNAVTGVSINPTGITGSGITGYANVIVEQESGFNIYQLSGLTGHLTGQTITYYTGATQSSGIEEVTIPESKLFNYSYLKQFASSNILFTNHINTTDEIEINARRDYPVENLNLMGVVNIGNSGFLLPTGYSSGNVNVFLNGAALYSGSDFSVLDNSFVKINTPFSGTDTLIYDVVTGSQFVSGFTGYNDFFIVNNADFATRDIYLNGLRLISGVDYAQYVPNTSINGSGLPTGTFLFLPRASGLANKQHAIGKNHVDVSFALIDEQVWINGLRQIRSKNYIKTSDDSLLNTELFITAVDNSFYNNENNFFNI